MRLKPLFHTSILRHVRPTPDDKTENKTVVIAGCHVGKQTRPNYALPINDEYRDDARSFNREDRLNTPVNDTVTLHKTIVC